MNYDIKTHGDFKRVWCKKTEKTYWLLGYFGGGDINISDAMEIAKLYAKETGVRLSSVMMGEIYSSSWCKFFKFVYSQENQEPQKDSVEVESFWKFVER